MTEAMPFLQKYDITFLRPPTICAGRFLAFHFVQIQKEGTCGCSLFVRKYI